MTWHLSQPEIAGVLRTSPEKRYAYWINRTADWKEVWSLRDQDGWILLGDDESGECIPVWPHEEYAKRYAASLASLKAIYPEKIPFLEFLNKWLPGMSGDQRQLAVFPVANERAITRPAKEVQLDLDRALDAIE